MGEVIHVDFKEKKITGKSVSGSIDTNKNFKIFGKEFLKGFCRRYKKEYEALMNAEVPPGITEADNPLEALDFSDQQLVGELQNSDPDSWYNRPRYFRALFTELESRLSSKNSDLTKAECREELIDFLSDKKMPYKNLMTILRRPDTAEHINTTDKNFVEKALIVDLTRIVLKSSPALWFQRPFYYQKIFDRLRTELKLP